MSHKIQVKCLFAILLLVFCGIGVGQGYAEVIVNFDDLSYGMSLTESNYAGLTWEIGNAGYKGNSGYWYIPNDPAEYLNPGDYPYSLPHNVINAWGSTLIGIGFPQLVNLEGAYFAVQGAESSWTTAVRVHGYQGENEVVVTDWFSEISTTPTWFAMNLENVDRIVIESEPTNLGGGWYGMDDLTYTPVPEPSSIVLLSMGWLGFFIYSWRKKSR